MLGLGWERCMMPLLLISSPLRLIMSEDDRRIRDVQRIKDKGLTAELQKEMQDEQRLLKGYFNEMKTTSDDPTVVKNEDVRAKRMESLKKALTGFTIYLDCYKYFWQTEGKTTEERLVLEQCKENIKRQIAHGLLLCMPPVLVVSYIQRKMMTPALHLFGITIGVATGCTYGMLQSTKYSLEKMEGLGEAYELGRNSSLEIDKFRLDKLR